MGGADAVVAIQQLQAAYADVVNRRAWTELTELFLPDAAIHLDTVTGPLRTLAGPDELGQFVGTAIERYDFFSFVILNAVVDVAGETATGRIFMCELRHEAHVGEWNTAYGLYRDDYRLAGGRWWFATRRYRSLARTGPDAGVFGLPPDL